MKFTETLAFAVISMMLGDFFIVIMGAFAKDLGTVYTAFDIAFFRNLIALCILGGWILASKQYHLIKTERPFGQIVRAVIGTVGLVMVFWSYTLLPLATVTSLLFLSPIMTLIMSIMFLKEKAGIYRWAAVLGGFIGMIVISLPALNENASAQIPLFGIITCFIAATAGASVQIMLRTLGKSGEPAVTTIIYFLLISTLITGVISIAQGIEFHSVLIVSMFGVGLAGLGNQIFKTLAFQKADASLLAPLRYISLIWSLIIGYIFWNEIPTWQTLSGAAIIIAANIVLIVREKQQKKHVTIYEN